MQQKRKGAEETWDEFEKSVVAHVADGVKVTIKGRTVEMTIIKKAGVTAPKCARVNPLCTRSGFTFSVSWIASKPPRRAIGADIGRRKRACQKQRVGVKAALSNLTECGMMGGLEGGMADGQAGIGPDNPGA